MDFAEAVAECLRAVPRGRVATCGEVAKALGDPRATRALATWAAAHPELPALHRLVFADGRPLHERALVKLRREGVQVRSGKVVGEHLMPSIPPTDYLKGLRREQRADAERVREQDDFDTVHVIGGVDVAYRGDEAYAVAVRWDANAHRVLEFAEARLRVDFPYIAGYLAYREFPAIRAAMSELREPPDVLLVDGHGRLHPARFGFACFAGLRLNLPTVGVAKRALHGEPRLHISCTTGAVPLTIAGELSGYAWTPPQATRPIYVSVGHRISLESALRLVQRSTIGRLPEPLRLADREARKRRREEKWEKVAGLDP